MSKIYQGAVELIGNTPLVEVINLEKEQELKARVLVKLEYRLKILHRKLYLQDVHDHAQHLLDDDAADGRDAHHFPVPGVSHHSPRNVHTDRHCNEFLQLSQSSELSQHDLAEDKLAGSCAQSC